MLRPICLLLLSVAVYCQTNIDPCEVNKIFNIPGDCNTTTTQDTPTQATPIVPTPRNRNQNTASTIVPPVKRENLLNTPCTMGDGSTGQCVHYYQCKNGTVNSDGEGLLDIRVLDAGPCGTVLLVCCALENKLLEPVTPKPAPRPEGCGWTNPKGADMRTTGETNGETKYGEFPWMVAILDTEMKPGSENGPRGLQQYIGGGSLIDPSAVLTAAHTVQGRKSLRIRAGEWDTQTTAEIYPYQERDVTTVEIHKDYIRGNLFYDVALLILAKPVDLAPHIGVACLPPPRVKANPGTRCFATGWGKDKFEADDAYSVMLKKIEVPVVKHYNCEQALQRTRLGNAFKLHSSFMCAGGEKGKDTCRGDGGSPLSCPIEYETDRYMQSGIVAWGIGCGEDGIPGVYVDVSVVRGWIDEKMVKNRLDNFLYRYDI